MNIKKYYKISEAAKQLNTTAVSLRYYERIGLLNPSHRSVGGYRLYQKSDFQRFQFINNAKAVGFELNEIKLILSFINNNQVSSKIIKKHIADKLDKVNQQMKSLKVVKQLLNELNSSCDGSKSASECPILKKLAEDL